MGHWTIRAIRGGTLLLVLLLGAILPGAGPISVSRAAAVVPANASDPEDAGDEPPGLIAYRAARDPRPSPTPGPTTVPKQLVVGELGEKKAPAPSGPSIYVPILMYHYIRVNPQPRDQVGFNLSTTPALFRSQMQYLADQGFHVISLHQAVIAIQNHTPLAPRSVVLTFDDGYADFFTEAVPVMRRYGFTATDFVISGRMGQWSFMTAAQVQAADSMGFTIGAHTVDHVALAALPPARALWEMRQSKLTLEALLGHTVLDFAYPYGSFNASAMLQAKTLGFETAASTLAGTVHSKSQLMFLSRVRVGGAMSLAYFAHLVGGPSPTAAEVRGTGPSASPTATPSSGPRPTPTPTPTPTPSQSPTPTATPKRTSLPVRLASG